MRRESPPSRPVDLNPGPGLIVMEQDHPTLVPPSSDDAGYSLAEPDPTPSPSAFPVNTPAALRLRPRSPGPTSPAKSEAEAKADPKAKVKTRRKRRRTPPPRAPACWAVCSRREKKRPRTRLTPISPLPRPPRMPPKPTASRRKRAVPSSGSSARKSPGRMRCPPGRCL